MPYLQYSVAANLFFALFLVLTIFSSTSSSVEILLNKRRFILSFIFTQNLTVLLWNSVSRWIFAISRAVITVFDIFYLFLLLQFCPTLCSIAFFDHFYAILYSITQMHYFMFKINLFYFSCFEFVVLVLRVQYDLFCVCKY